MRVALLTTSFPRQPDDAAGHFVQANAEQLVSEGHEVHVVAAGRPPTQRPERRGAITIHWAGGGSLFGWPGAMARARSAPWRIADAIPYALRARRLLRQLAPQRVVAHWLVPNGWPILAQTDYVVDVVAHGADIRLLLTLPAPLRRHICTALLHRGATFYFAAESARQQLLDCLPHGAALAVRKRSRICPPALALPDASAIRARARRLRRQLPGPASDPVIVVVGRLVADKAPELALAAAASLRFPVRLFFVGEGPLSTRLSAASQRLGVAAYFVGQQPRSVAFEYLAAADALVHPSSHEAAPCVVREARHFGTPVVATAVGDVALWAAEDREIMLSRAVPLQLAAALERALGRAG